MKTLAAILVETGKPLALEELEIPALKPGQVLTQIACSGVCHTQVLECRGLRGEDKFVPHCLGHEAGGTVLEIGAGVTKVKPGDAVILSWIKGSGANVPGTTYTWRGRNVNAGAVTTFSQHAVVSENRLTIKPAALSMTQAALLGCAVPTGAGAVFNAAQPRAGQSLVVFGIGGVGGCAVGAAVAAGCNPVIAVDVVPEKLELARALGATHVVHGRQEDAVQAIAKICPGGADFAIEATGRPEVMRQALQCVRQQGGTAVVIGNAPFGQMLTLDPFQFNLGKRLLGTWGGDSVPDRDYPRFGELIASGKLPLHGLTTRAYALTEINQAIDDLEAARVARPIVEMMAGGLSV